MARMRKRFRGLFTEDVQPGTPLPTSPRSINRQAKLHRLLKQLHSNSGVCEGDLDSKEAHQNKMMSSNDVPSSSGGEASTRLVRGVPAYPARKVSRGKGLGKSVSYRKRAGMSLETGARVSRKKATGTVQKKTAGPPALKKRVVDNGAGSGKFKAKLFSHKKGEGQAAMAPQAAAMTGRAGRDSASNKPKRLASVTDQELKSGSEKGCARELGWLGSWEGWG